MNDIMLTETLENFEFFNKSKSIENKTLLGKISSLGEMKHPYQYWFTPKTG